ncbi:MAG: S-layer homology domain-containing protein [Acidimicrobiales bacterium]|nr:S-layer homology domain-containing protein [Acidimicrobiales bacterium]
MTSHLPRSVLTSAVGIALMALLTLALVPLVDPAGATVSPASGRGFPLACPANDDHPFTDVGPADYSNDAVACLHQLGLLNGTSPTTVSPDAVADREQAAALLARLWRAAGNSCIDVVNPFTDLSAQSFAYADVLCIYGAGLTTGTTPTTYDPAGILTRAQAAAFVARLWRALGGECSTAAAPFTDVPADLFARLDIDCLYALGITTGTSATTYGPNDPIPRAQLLTFLGRLIVAAADELGEIEDLDLMSFNIRYDNPDDDPDWSTRLPAILDMLDERQPDVMGIQEGLHHQVLDLAAGLPDYAWIGVGRDDGVTAGEFAAIFYRIDEFAVVDSGTFWLSETPDVVSRGWDAALERIATWAQLRRIGSAETFFVFNTHFDHVGTTARVESAALIAEKVGEIADGKPAFIMGDLNVLPADAALDPIREIMDDSQSTATVTDDVGSFNAFLAPGGLWNIDYIFYDTGTATVHDTVDDDYGVSFISDHFPVTATMKCEPCG